MCNFNIIKTLINVSMFKKLEKINKISKKEDVVFLCVGNFKVWYDSFGPLVSYFLKKNNFGWFVYGDINNCITLNNIDKYIKCIKKFHVKPFIIVVDSSVSKDGVEGIKIVDGGLKIGCLSGGAVFVGDMGITYCLDIKKLPMYDNYKLMIQKTKKFVRLVNCVLSS